MTEDKKYTKEGLPIISLERLNSFGREFQIVSKEITENKGLGPTLGGWIDEMDASNKGASSYLVSAAKMFHPLYRPMVHAVLAGFYELLRSQAEANKLEEELDP